MKWTCMILAAVLAVATACAAPPTLGISAVTNRIAKVLPEGWKISWANTNCSPDYLETANGIGIGLAIQGKKYSKQQMECVIYLMPTNYVGQPGPHESEQQTPSARPLGETTHYRVFIWGWWISHEWPSFKEDILGALKEEK